MFSWKQAVGYSSYVYDDRMRKAQIGLARHLARHSNGRRRCCAVKSQQCPFRYSKPVQLLVRSSLRSSFIFFPSSIFSSSQLWKLAWLRFPKTFRTSIVHLSSVKPSLTQTLVLACPHDKVLPSAVPRRRQHRSTRTGPSLPLRATAVSSASVSVLQAPCSIPMLTGFQCRKPCQCQTDQLCNLIWKVSGCIDAGHLLSS